MRTSFFAWAHSRYAMWMVGLMTMVTVQGCGSKPQRQHPVVVEPRPVDTAPERVDDSSALVTAETSETLPLAGFFDELTNLLKAAMSGGPPPATAISLKYPDEREQTLRWPAGVRPNPSKLVFFALLLEMELVFDTKTSAGERQTVRLDVIHSQHGLRVTRIGEGSTNSVRSLPPWLEGAETAADQVLTAARGGSLNQMLAGPSEVAVFGSNDNWKQVVSRGLDSDDIEGLEAIAPSLGTVAGYVFDDLWVFARDDNGTVLRFRFDMDFDDGRVVLDNHPLARVEIVGGDAP